MNRAIYQLKSIQIVAEVLDFDVWTGEVMVLIGSQRVKLGAADMGGKQCATLECRRWFFPRRNHQLRCTVNCGGTQRVRDWRAAQKTKA
jgi:hypothetical protein